jgi:hypothetical protein
MIHCRKPQRVGVFLLQPVLRTVVVVAVAILATATTVAAAAAAAASNSIQRTTPIVDATGKVAHSFLLSTSASSSSSALSGDVTSGIVTIVTSPGVPSLFLPPNVEAEEEEVQQYDPALLSVWDTKKEGRILVCSGSTFTKGGRWSVPSSTSSDVSHASYVDPTGTCLQVCSSVSNVMVLEGVTLGDIVTEGGILYTRHARTLGTLFQSRIRRSTVAEETTTTTTKTKQTLILAVAGTAASDNDNSDMIKRVAKDVQVLFQMATIGICGQKFEDMYDLLVVPVSASTAAQVGCILSS